MAFTALHCVALCRKGDDPQLNVRVSVTSVEALLAQNQTGSRFFIFYFLFCFGATGISDKHENLRGGDSISKLVNTYMILCQMLN